MLCHRIIEFSPPKRALYKNAFYPPTFGITRAIGKMEIFVFDVCWNHTLLECECEHDMLYIHVMVTFLKIRKVFLIAIFKYKNTKVWLGT